MPFLEELLLSFHWEKTILRSIFEKLPDKTERMKKKLQKIE